MVKKTKKREQTEKPAAPTQDNKVPKNYIFPTSTQKENATAKSEDIPKIRLSADQEEKILELILEANKSRARSGSASKRLSTKKLTDLYQCLASAGFKHQQIEAAMSDTVEYGGDLIDALDWLCLHTANDRLPGGFSNALAEEEEKHRPKSSLSSYEGAVGEVTTALAASSLAPAAPHPTPPSRGGAGARGSADRQAGGGGKRRGTMKDWILQYAEMSSDDEEDQDEGDREDEDPNDRYLELAAKLVDAKTQAKQAKESSDKALLGNITKKITQYIQEIKSLEKHPDFNPDVKISGMEEEMDSVSSSASKATEVIPKVEPKVKAADKPEVDFDCSGLAMFEEEAAKVAKVAPPKPKVAAAPPPKLDIRDFTYTKQQWTGKSPKQFLIDWVRKNLKTCPPPSYNKEQVRGNLWRSRCKVHKTKEELLTVRPDIVCEHAKDAEHLASTLALYQLCRGQRVYQLLPPPYRDVWLEWLKAEEEVKEQNKVEENKPRDQFVARLMKKVKAASPTRQEAEHEVEDTDDVGESWEDLDSDQDQDDAPIARAPRGGVGTLPSGPSSGRLRALMADHQASRQFGTLVATRRELPVWQHRARILDQLNKARVLVVAGETGSGKSTQVPQFLLEDLVLSGRGSECNIVCTQPRRISATSLAGRVGQELGGPPPGRPGSLCGYQIRFDVQRSDTCRLLYCTTGVVLRRLQIDPTLADVTHVIVDEVHERTVQSDFLLILLKRLLDNRRDLRVILMSATLDAQKFSAFFQHCPVLEIPGRTYPVQVFHVEDVVEMTGYKLEMDSPYSLRDHELLKEETVSVEVTGRAGRSHTVEATFTKEDAMNLDKSGLDPESYSKATRNVVTRLHPSKVNMELICELIHYLEIDESFAAVTGAILVFLPGLAHIQELHDLLTSDRRFSDKNRYRIIALHSILTSNDQNLAFTEPPPGIRKVVIATNIAETGITIPDVVFVIDSGKVKENRYIETTQMSSLQEVFTSQASAKQRQGRAGRVREGYCFRMYTTHKFQNMKAYSVPEILRVPLEELCLHIMKCDLGSPAEFLGQALDPPQHLAVSRAMSILGEVGACLMTPDAPPTLTPLGLHLASLPVNVRVGKMLVYGAILGCLQPMAVVCAALMEKSPFAAPLGKRAEADAARRSLAVHDSDHLTLLNAYVGWKSAQRNGGQRTDRRYCQQHFLTRNTLIDIENVAQDLIKLLESAGFSTTLWTKPAKSATASKPPVAAPPDKRDVINISQSGLEVSLTSEWLSAKMAALLKAVLAAGLYPHVARVTWTPRVDSAANPEKVVCMTLTPQGHIQVHPASVNRFLGANGWLVYLEKVKASRPYLRDSTLITPTPLLLFGGNIDVHHKQQLITVDNWIKFKAVAKTGVMFKELRRLVDDVLSRKLEDPQLSVTDEPAIRAIVALIIADARR